MRQNRQPEEVSRPVRTGAPAFHRPGHRARAGVIRLVSVTAVAAATCALWAMPAGAATANAARRFSTATHVSASPATADVGAAVKLSATVTSPGRIPAGTVTFTWNGVRLCVARLRWGSGSCDTRFSRDGKYWVQGTYARNRYYWGSWGFARVKVVTPPKHATTTTITGFSPNPDLAGDPSTVSVTVTSAGDSVPTGTVVVAPTFPTGLPAPYTCTATLVGGKGSCAVTPGAGTFGDTDYEATYSGDATHTGSVSTGSHVLIVPETTTTTVTPATATAGSVTLTATVIGQDKGNISPSAGGTGTVSFSAAPSTGPATFIPLCSNVALTYDGGGANVATCTTTALTPGKYLVEAAYSGDPNNLKSEGTETLVVS